MWELNKLEDAETEIVMLPLHMTAKHGAFVGRIQSVHQFSSAGNPPCSSSLLWVQGLPNHRGSCGEWKLISSQGHRERCVRSDNFGNSNAGLLPSWKARLCPEFVAAAAMRNSPLLYKCQSGASLPKKFALKFSVQVWKVESLYEVNPCALLKKSILILSGVPAVVVVWLLRWGVWTGTHWRQEKRNFAEVQVNLVLKHPYCQFLFFPAVNGYCWSAFYQYFIPHNTTYII